MRHPNGFEHSPVIAERSRNEEFLLEEKRILEQIASDRPFGQCLEAITELISRLASGIRACILIANHERTAIADCFSLHLSPSFASSIVGAPINGVRIGTCGTAMYTGLPISCSDIANSDDWSAEWKNLCLVHAIRACHSRPILSSEGKAIGSLFLCLSEPSELSHSEQRIAEFGARVAGIVIERVRVHSELLRSKAQLEEELADARLLQKLSMALVHEDGTASLYQKIVDAAVIIMRSQYASMQVLYPETGSIGKLQLVASSGFSPEAQKFWEWVYPATGSSCGATLRAGKRIIISDFANCDFMQGTDTLPLFLAGGIYAAQSTPLYSRGGKLLGMISTHWTYVHTPSERDLSLLDILARQAADLIERNQTSEALKQSEERLRALMTQLEKRVEERTKELQRSNEDLQQFAHVASHDLKEPVRKIKTFGYRLQEEMAKTASEKSKLYVEKMMSSAERMALMIEGVLSYSTFNAVERKIEELDLNKIISDIHNDLEVLIHQKEATVRHDTLPRIEGVQVLIYQLFYNLLNNSLKFSKPDRKLLITISTRTVDREGTSYAEIEIADNGIGFEPSYDGKIFDAFTRLNARDKYDGTGLGLSLCRKIVERHRGTIKASGQKNVGAVFTIILPFKQTAFL